MGTHIRETIPGDCLPGAGLRILFERTLKPKHPGQFWSDSKKQCLRREEYKVPHIPCRVISKSHSHTCMHAQYTYMHTYTYTYVNTYINLYEYTFLHLYTHTHIPIFIYIYTHAHAHIHVFTHVHVYTLIHMHANAHIYTSTHAHIDTHTYTQRHLLSYASEKHTHNSGSLATSEQHSSPLCSPGPASVSW